VGQRRASSNYLRLSPNHPSERGLAGDPDGRTWGTRHQFNKLPQVSQNRANLGHHARGPPLFEPHISQLRQMWATTGNVGHRDSALFD
jgi:hypothetical protein